MVLLPYCWKIGWAWWLVQQNYYLVKLLSSESNVLVFDTLSFIQITPFVFNDCLHLWKNSAKCLSVKCPTTCNTKTTKWRHITYRELKYHTHKLPLIQTQLNMRQAKDIIYSASLSSQPYKACRDGLILCKVKISRLVDILLKNSLFVFNPCIYFAVASQAYVERTYITQSIGESCEFKRNIN